MSLTYSISARLHPVHETVNVSGECVSGIRSFDDAVRHVAEMVVRVLQEDKVGVITCRVHTPDGERQGDFKVEVRR
jgi:hypothetical protein